MKTLQEQHLLDECAQLGLVAEFTHHRNKDKWHGEVFPSTKGGYTTCKLIDSTDPEKPDVRAVGYAQCSDYDNYNKGIGRVISLGRALKKLDHKE